MLQDISPHLYDNRFSPREARSDDYLVCFSEGKILLNDTEKGIVIPRYGEVLEWHPETARSPQYLFTLDGRGYFLIEDVHGEVAHEGYSYHEGFALLSLQPSWMAFGAVTALHLASWYQSHRYCGTCGTALEHGSCERMLACPQCGQIEYPKIAPVVIVGVTRGDELLLTRSAHAHYRRYALVAGFVEIGETLEDAAQREVMEETGLKIKNIRYFKSQPWALSESLIMGLFADVDGDSTVALHDGELSEATWFKRSDIPVEDSNISITWDMILAFGAGLVS
jgi:NAD+ diphosphatase